MAEITAGSGAAPPARRGGRGLLVGIGLALLLGAGGFAATYLGLVALPLGGAGPGTRPAVAPLGPVAFLPLEPFQITLGTEARARQLRVAAELEIDPAYREDVELLMPRIRDVANSFLRAVEVRDLEDPRAMPRLRAQLLRRIQIVTGEGRVTDLLLAEFILN